MVHCLQAVLGFIGITEVAVVRVEGPALPGMQDTALKKGLASIRIATQATH